MPTEETTSIGDNITHYPFMGKSEEFIKIVMFCICRITCHLCAKQVEKLDCIFEVEQYNIPGLKENREAFDSAVSFCEKQMVITAIKNGYAYRLAQFHRDHQKNIEEVFKKMEA